MQGDTIDATILDIMLRAGSRWVLWVLIFLSFAAVAVMIERAWFFFKERKPDRELREALDALRAKGPSDAKKRLEGLRSMHATVMRACLSRAEEGAEAVDEHRTAIVEEERLRYERRLAFLGTLGNNAPFIGLFGTVLGIIRAFSDLSVSSAQGTEAVMAGISEALVATGVGLLVALPAVATYNAFSRHVETSVASADGYAHEVLSYLKKVA